MLFGGFGGHPPLRDRVDAGQQLARHPEIAKHANSPNTIILALPRGGLPVAFQVAKTLNVPLDLMLVRKLGLPYHEEVAMGAIAMGGVSYVDPTMVGRGGVTDSQLEAVRRRESAELERRTRKYRGDKPYPVLTGKNVIIIDDGIATGATLRAAILAVRVHNPARIIAAAPVGAPDSVQTIGALTDEIVCLHQPRHFNAVGMW
ncbi:hypothetical protein PhCBS80983_g01872 [Powellomyces hirtus]|uniref:Phosphoribosyltransferase domain-containing protein n=1 Tax=Powellomyces hirtus TaxID=109895 RepID=A0A507EAJ6_9FUNG|nr:hypothetical protein PhCBS80983_g01872 [Powellomyces hirtus]